MTQASAREGMTIDFSPSLADHEPPDADPPAIDSATGILTPAELYRMHYVGLLRLAAMLVGDRETGEDIVQDVFARMQGRSLKEPDKAIRYLRISVVNAARSALRHRGTVARHTESEPAASPAAEHDALRRLTHQAVRRAVDALPRRQREVVILRYLEELSVAETARILRITSGAVKASAGRAMATLATTVGNPDV